MSQGYDDSAVENLLVETFLSITHRDYPVLDFIEKVYKIDVINLPRDLELWIRGLDLDSFSRGIDAAPPGATVGSSLGERGSDAPFIRIMDSLVEQSGLKHKRNIIKVIRDEERSLGSQFLYNKADLSFTMAQDKKKISHAWLWQGLVFELGGGRVKTEFKEDLRVKWNSVFEEVRFLTL